MKRMATYSIYERITPIIGESYSEFVGTVEAATERFALNKAAKKFKYVRFVNSGGRRRKPENFTASKIGL